MRRRLFALLLCAVMLLGLLPTAALADEKPALPDNAGIEYSFTRSLSSDTADNEYARALCNLHVRLVNFPDITMGDANMVTITYTIPGETEPQQTHVLYEHSDHLLIPVEFIGKKIEITASMSQYTGSVTVTTDVVTQRAYNTHDVGVTIESIGRNTVTVKRLYRSDNFGQKCAISTAAFDPNATTVQTPDTCDWQECDASGQVSFTGLQAGTTYYVWSRYTESGTYIEGEKTDSTSFTTTSGEIDAVSGVSVPTLPKNGKPKKTVTLPPNADFTSGDAVWYVGESATGDPMSEALYTQPGQKYTVKITLTAKSGLTFAESLNGSTTSDGYAVTHNSATQLTLVQTFTAPEKDPLPEDARVEYYFSDSSAATEGDADAVCGRHLYVRLINFPAHPGSGMRTITFTRDGETEEWFSATTSSDTYYYGTINNTLIGQKIKIEASCASYTGSVTTTTGVVRAASAEDPVGGSVPALRTSGLTGGQGSYVYFGAYQQDATAPEGGATQPTGTEGEDWIEYEGEYFHISPVKWRVLAAEESAAVSGTDGTETIDTALLLADTALDSMPFHTDNEGVLWSTSTIRSWLNGYGASENTGGSSGTDYSAAGANFITAAFSAMERDAIAAARVQDEVSALIASTARHIASTGGTYDKVFLLSETEAANTAYGFSAETVGEGGTNFPDRLAALNAYNKAKLAYTYGGDEFQVGTTMVEWWLRTMDDDGSYSDAAAFEAAVNAQGYAGADELVKVGDHGGYFYNQDVNKSTVNVRPAFRLDLDQVIFVRAVNCESSGGAAVARQSALGLKPVPNAAAGNNEYALTVYDSSRSGFTVTPDPASKGSETAVTFTYSGAKTGTNEYISAIIKDVATGDILYYGQVKALTGTGDSSGTVTVEISGKFSAGCALYIFNEQVNGEKETNYASRPASVFPLFNVTYAPDDNSTGTTVVDTKAYDETLTLKNAVFTRTGYTQTGWATEKNGAKVYDLGGSYAPNADVTLYPVWTANTYSVRFNGNDATGGSMDDQSFTYDAEAVALRANGFTRTGHHFVKWTVNADGTGTSYTDGQEVRNLTATPGGIVPLYAQWEKDTYTITYASGTAGSGAAIPAATKTYGEPLTLSDSVFTRQGWVQTGWATAENGAKVYGLGGSYTDNAAATLYPAWTRVSTVTFDPNAADGGAVEPQQADTSLSYRLTLAELPVPTRDSDDYRFDGWFTERDGGEQITLDTVFPTDTTVYAHWTYLTTPISAYPITVDETENGTVASSRKRAHEGVRITITVTPDAGWTLKALTVVDEDGNEIELKQDGNVFTFVMPDSGVTVSGTFAGLRGFVDVPEGKYFYNAVEWAAANGITGGTDATHFSPYAICTRAQIITFLWRAAGCPAPKRLSDFRDVPADAYYAEAVAWAVEKNITGGVTDEIFAPGMPCTRAQAVTFLFRYARRMDLDAVTTQELISGYDDAANVPIYAISAFNWALAGGVVTGDNGSLKPNGFCTRAQIVTMLYRFLTK